MNPSDIKQIPEPGWTEEGDAFIVKVTEHWIVAVTPMLFNDRIVIASPEEYGRFWTAGFCYSRDFHYSTLETIFAATLWDPETEMQPKCFVKVAYDLRQGSLL